MKPCDTGPLAYIIEESDFEIVRKTSRYFLTSEGVFFPTEYIGGGVYECKVCKYVDIGGLDMCPFLHIANMKCRG